MSLEMVTRIVRKETMKEDMEDLMSFDWDFIGNNGEEFTSDKANEVGKTDFEYVYDMCDSEKYGFNFGKFFETFYWGNLTYYGNMKYEITPISEDTYVITIAYVTEE